MITIRIPDERWFRQTLADNWPGGIPSGYSRAVAATVCELDKALAELNPHPLGPAEPVFAEINRAVEKFPTWPTDPLHALAVLGEEYGELTKAVLQQVYEPHKNPADAVRKEAVQVAAMALRFLASLDTYQYRACPQHSQGSASNTVIDGATPHIQVLDGANGNPATPPA